MVYNRMTTHSFIEHITRNYDKHISAACMAVDILFETMVYIFSHLTRTCSQIIKIMCLVLKCVIEVKARTTKTLPVSFPLFIYPPEVVSLCYFFL